MVDAMTREVLNMAEVTGKPKQLIACVQHEGIVTRDAERSKEFYVKLLDLQVLPRPPLTSKGYWLGVAPDVYPQLHIIQSELQIPGPDAPINPRSRHTCFETPDYDGLKLRMQRDGIKYVENEQPNGRTQMLCNDPDGHTLEFQRLTK
jgi:catechol 2,3-dioxygenase-like lactoylglutathione lyase family enzyme